MACTIYSSQVTVICMVVGPGETTLSTLGNVYLITPQRIETNPNAAYR